MKVSELLTQLQALDPSDDICVLYWEKSSFEFPEDYEIVITAKGWKEVCEEFDQWDDAGSNTTTWISDAVIDKAEVNA